MTPPRPTPLTAFLVGMIGIATFSGMDAVMKGLVLALGIYATMVWRMLAGVVMAGALFAARPNWPTRAVLRIHLLRESPEIRLDLDERSFVSDLLQQKAEVAEIADQGKVVGTGWSGSTHSCYYYFSIGLQGYRVGVASITKGGNELASVAEAGIHSPIAKIAL